MPAKNSVVRTFFWIFVCFLSIFEFFPSNLYYTFVGIYWDWKHPRLKNICLLGAVLLTLLILESEAFCRIHSDSTPESSTVLTNIMVSLVDEWVFIWSKNAEMNDEWDSLNHQHIKFDKFAFNCNNFSGNRAWTRAEMNSSRRLSNLNQFQILSLVLYSGWMHKL